jgi:hypothetical protein
MTKEQLELVVKCSNERMNHFQLLVTEGKGDYKEIFTIENGEVLHNGDVILSKEHIEGISPEVSFSLGMSKILNGYYNYRVSQLKDASDVNALDALDFTTRSVTL